MKLTCSCGASAEFSDGLVGSVESNKWQQRHEKCLPASEINSLRVRCENYQASRDWAIKKLTKALGYEADTVRAIEYYASEAAIRIEQQQAWKQEVLGVLADWDKVWEAAGKPGLYGESRAKATAARVTGLMEQVEWLKKYHNQNGAA